MEYKEHAIPVKYYRSHKKMMEAMFRWITENGPSVVETVNVVHDSIMCNYEYVDLPTQEWYGVMSGTKLTTPDDKKTIIFVIWDVEEYFDKYDDDAKQIFDAIKENMYNIIIREE